MQALEFGGGEWLSGRMLDLNSRGRKCKPQNVGGGGQWLSGRMLDLNSRGRKCMPQRWGAMAQW